MLLLFTLSCATFAHKLEWLRSTDRGVSASGKSLRKKSGHPTAAPKQFFSTFLLLCEDTSWLCHYSAPRGWALTKVQDLRHHSNTSSSSPLWFPTFTFSLDVWLCRATSDSSTHAELQRVKYGFNLAFSGSYKVMHTSFGDPHSPNRVVTNHLSALLVAASWMPPTNLVESNRSCRSWRLHP